MNIIKSFIENESNPAHFSFSTLLIATMWDATMCVLAFSQSFHYSVLHHLHRIVLCCFWSLLWCSACFVLIWSYGSCWKFIRKTMLMRIFIDSYVSLMLLHMVVYSLLFLCLFWPMWAVMYLLLYLLFLFHRSIQMLSMVSDLNLHQGTIFNFCFYVSCCW